MKYLQYFGYESNNVEKLNRLIKQEKIKNIEIIEPKNN